MKYRTIILGTITSLSVLLAGATYAHAQRLHGEGETAHSSEQASAFQAIEQPLWSKLVVTGVGLSCIGFELWWFVLSKNRPHKATLNN